MKGIIVYALVLAFLTIGQAEADGQSSPEKPQQKCTPGLQTREACNTCTCARDGTGFACTRMACPNIPAEYLNPDGSIKLPNSRNPLLRNKREYVRRVLFGK